MITTAQYTVFTYNLSRVDARYYNKCIRASTTTLDINALGSVTPDSFALLSNEINWGFYVGPSLPANLQITLTTQCGVFTP